MPHIHSKSSRPATAVLVLVLASLVLAACGGSSSTTTSTTNASATTPTTGGTPGAAGGRFAAVRECLQKNGITLPKRTPGQRPSPGTGGGFLGGGGPTLPKGVTKAQYEAAIKKCGGFPRGGFKGGAGGFNSAAGKQALAKFAACMSENGVKIPAPNTSGNGPIFNTKGIDTASAKFREAEAKCRTDLLGAFRARPGAGGAPGTAAG
ncbi:MAG: hypothetical protein ACLPUT_02750 [Solirubrobacteraceae bacterium]